MHAPPVLGAQDLQQRMGLRRLGLQVLPTPDAASRPYKHHLRMGRPQRLRQLRPAGLGLLPALQRLEGQVHTAGAQEGLRGGRLGGGCPGQAWAGMARGQTSPSAAAGGGGLCGRPYIHE
jgi:hypothetical protein